MKEVNGLKYSKEVFDDYLFSAKIKLKTEYVYHTIDIYTTDTNKESLLSFIDTVKREDVISVELLNWSSKESDILQAEFIDEWLKDI